MSGRFKWPKPKEAFFLFAAICLLLAPEFMIKLAVFNTMALVELLLMLLMAACLVFPLWAFYQAFLKGPLRARRIERIRHRRLLREVLEEQRLRGSKEARRE